MHGDAAGGHDPDRPEPDRDDDDADYEVGYRRPPLHGRFKPGQSGNPKGRPKGSRNLATLLQAELRRPVSVTEGGRTRRVPKAVAMAATQINKALKGDTRAFATVLQVTRPRPGDPAGGFDPTDEAGLAGAREFLRERLERVVREGEVERERMAGALAAAGVPWEHLDLLYGPQGERLRERLTAALRELRARGIDIREAARASIVADTAGECAEALLAEAPDG